MSSKGLIPSMEGGGPSTAVAEPEPHRLAFKEVKGGFELLAAKPLVAHEQLHCHGLLQYYDTLDGANGMMNDGTNTTSKSLKSLQVGSTDGSTAMEVDTLDRSALKCGCYVCKQREMNKKDEKDEHTKVFTSECREKRRECMEKYVGTRSTFATVRRPPIAFATNFTIALRSDSAITPTSPHPTLSYPTLPYPRLFAFLRGICVRILIVERDPTTWCMVQRAQDRERMHKFRASVLGRRNPYKDHWGLGGAWKKWPNAYEVRYSLFAI